MHLQGQFCIQKVVGYHNVAYMPKARTVAADKQPLLGNGPYTRSRETRHVLCGVTQQSKKCCKVRSLWVRSELFVTQLCGKHISAAVNQHATIEEAVFPWQRLLTVEILQFHVLRFYLLSLACRTASQLTLSLACNISAWTT
jgi:hypothetical protein